MRIFVALLLFFSMSGIFAQENGGDNDVWVQLYVFDADEQKAMENMQVVSYETMLVYRTDSLGLIKGYFDSMDSLKITGMGFQPVVVKVADFKGKENGKMVFLSRQTIMLRAVDIPAQRDIDLHMPDDIRLDDGKEDDTPVSLRASDYSKKPSFYKAAINPVGFAHYYLSKSERQKRKDIQELQEQEKQSKINKIYNRDIVAFVTGYKEEQLDDFMLYCNLNLEVNENSNPIILQQDILDLMVKYQKEKNSQKEGAEN